MSLMINHDEGDATLAPGVRPAAIIHVCNDAGGWGAGFVLALSKRWALPEKVYRKAAAGHVLALGMNQVVRLADGLWVVNMVAQRGWGKGGRAVSYDALDECLSDVYTNVVPFTGVKRIHAPLIGAGLGGGDWGVIEAILDAHATVPTTIWHLP